MAADGLQLRFIPGLKDWGFHGFAP